MNVSHPSLPIQSAVGYSLQASKWQKCPMLVDLDEMRRLLTSLGEFWIVQISGLVPIKQEIIRQEIFLETYHQYITALKQGKLPEDIPHLRPCFSSVWTTTLEAVYAVPVNPTHCLVKVHRPVVQLQIHRFDYSPLDGKFRSMVLGHESILWGIQFSYPYLYQDSNDQVFSVKEDTQFPNTALFKRIQQWMRSETIATPFEIEGKQMKNVPIRLGKQCLNWINDHPQLKAKHLVVCK